MEDKQQVQKKSNFPTLFSKCVVWGKKGESNDLWLNVKRKFFMFSSEKKVVSMRKCFVLKERKKDGRVLVSFFLTHQVVEWTHNWKLWGRKFVAKHLQRNIEKRVTILLPPSNYFISSEKILCLRHELLGRLKFFSEKHCGQDWSWHCAVILTGSQPSFTVIRFLTSRFRGVSVCVVSWCWKKKARRNPNGLIEFVKNFELKRTFLRVLVTLWNVPWKNNLNFFANNLRKIMLINKFGIVPTKQKKRKTCCGGERNREKGHGF